MMQDESITPLFKQFEGLITEGKSRITGGFTPLRYRRQERDVRNICRVNDITSTTTNNKTINHYC
jgi:hypothetical protein